MSEERLREEWAAAQHARLQQAARGPQEHLNIRAPCKLGQAGVQLGGDHHCPRQVRICLQQQSGRFPSKDRVCQCPHPACQLLELSDCHTMLAMPIQHVVLCSNRQEIQHLQLSCASIWQAGCS